MDKRFIIYTLLNIVISGILSYLFSEIIVKNTDAMNLIVNTFSILSGFLFIVIGVVGELALFKQDDNSSDKINKHRNFEIRFTRFSTLFVMYLCVLLLIFIHFVLKETDLTDEPLALVTHYFKVTIHYLIVFSTAFCFMASIRLPWSLKRLIEEKNNISYHS